MIISLQAMKLVFDVIDSVVYFFVVLGNRAVIFFLFGYIAQGLDD